MEFVNTTTEDEGERAELLNSVRAMLTPARQYMAQQRIKHEPALAIAELAEYVIPARARELLLRNNIAENNAAREKFRRLLKLVPLVLKESLEANPANHNTASQRKRTSILAEIDIYLAAAVGVARTFPLTDFWLQWKEELPHLFDFFVLMGTLQASSAHSERVLSRYQRRFGDANIKDAKEDYVEASIMAEVNDIDFDEQLRIQVQPEVEEPQEEGDGEADE